MIKRLPYLLLLLLVSCLNTETSDPYADSLNELSISVVYTGDLEPYIRAGIEINITDRNLNSTFSAQTDADGKAVLSLPNGSYRITASDLIDGETYNASSDKVILSGSAKSLTLYMSYAKSGELLLKEIYFGGCSAYPEQGNYIGDAYLTIHNNSTEVQYLDSLCFGTLDPYNSTGTNVWTSVDEETGETTFQDYVPIIQALWQFPGDGDDFPLEPGEDAVLVIYGAVDHTQTYPNSVNLNQEGFFVLYNTTYFWNTKYHPAPGTNISQDRYLNVVIKTGQANAYTFSVTSPATVIFKTPSGTTIQDFIADPDNVIQKPGSSIDRVVCVPIDWVMDGAEVFVKNGTNSKRMPTEIDAGSIDFSGSYQGHSIMRYVDEEASAARGYEVLVDSNNSAVDFYETQIQSLHE